MIIFDRPDRPTALFSFEMLLSYKAILSIHAKKQQQQQQQKTGKHIQQSPFSVMLQVRTLYHYWKRTPSNEFSYKFYEIVHKSSSLEHLGAVVSVDGNDLVHNVNHFT